MKLARTTLFVICANDLDRTGRNYRQPPRPNAIRAFDIRRPSSRLAAKWYVCPQTHRLECAWSFELLASDDQLCRHATQRRLHGQASRRGRRLMRPCGPNRPSLSQIRNGLL